MDLDRYRGDLVHSVEGWAEVNKAALAALAAGAVVFVAIARKRAGGGVVALANAIAKAEGYGIPGAIPTVANNPGDLKKGDVGYGTINGITKYANVQDGWNALYAQLQLIVDGRSTRYKVTDTLRKMGQVWTATVSEQGAWSKNVAAALGVTPDATIGDVT